LYRAGRLDGAGTVRKRGLESLGVKFAGVNAQCVAAVFVLDSGWVAQRPAQPMHVELQLLCCARVSLARPQGVNQNVHTHGRVRPGQQNSQYHPGHRGGKLNRRLAESHPQRAEHFELH
jgi:hypothetical protein